MRHAAAYETTTAGSANRAQRIATGRCNYIDVPRRIRWSEFAILLLAFSLATVAMTWPLWQHPTRRLPSDLIDTLLNTWIIGWDADRFRHALRGVWDAPIFFPYRNTLAFSENLFGIAVFVAPVYWMTGNAVLTYNVAFTLSFALAGAGMYLLAVELTGSRRAAIVAAAFYAFCPFRFVQVSHIQLIATGWLPIALFALHRYFTTRDRRMLGVFAVACWLQVLSNAYMAYFIAVPIVIAIVAALWRPRADRLPMIVDLAAAGLVIAVALAPVAWQYVQVRSTYGQVRRLVEMDMGAADLRSYFIGHKWIGMWRWLRADAPTEGERELFPGVTAVVLATASLALVSRRAESARWVIAYATTAIVAALLSMAAPIRWKESCK